MNLLSTSTSRWRLVVGGALILGALRPGLAQTLVITEFMASNQETLFDGFGDSSDWIEIHNPHDQALSSGGYVLRDEDTDWPLPETTIHAGAHLVVFASGGGELDPEGAFHATFRLAKSGEPLSLVSPGGQVVSSFDQTPPQRTDISYGIKPDGTPAFFAMPTPGEPNESGVQGFVEDVQFSVERGFFDEAFELEITTETRDATILYTTDGRDPHKGILFNPVSTYSGPITIDKTITIRALAKKSGFAGTGVGTHTYIFTKDVIRQPAEPSGFPTSWGEFTGTNGSVRGRPVPADYEMNPAMVNDDPGEMEAALKSLPTVSIAMDPADLFGGNGILANPFGGINGSGVHNMNPFVRDRPSSLEWMDPNGGPELQIDCGIRLNGGWSRHYIASPKKSFSLLFKEEFGPTKLNFPVFPGSPVREFDRILLKAIFSNAWPDAASPPEYLRDHFTRQTRIDMGGPSSHGSWVHLYLNGLYWGIYNPSERPDASYAASHFGGEKDEYDALKHAGLRGPEQATTDLHEAIDGNDGKWKAALGLARSGLEDAESYEAFKEIVDVENLADYAILNIYASNVDWPHKNWYANAKREGGSGFRFYSWDAEYAWHDVNANRITVDNRNTPAELYAKVRRNKDFQRLFGDRVQKHLFGAGALTTEASIARYTRMAAVIEPAIVAEAARWGDNGNTRQGRTNYTKGSWESARDGVINNFLARRHDKALEQFIRADLYPELEAPVLNQYGGEVETGFALTMRSKDAKNLLRPSGGDMYFTTDGSDPRRPDNSVSETATNYDGPVELAQSVNVRARLMRKNLFTGGEWSALTEASFIVGAEAATSTSLAISKIHYRPSVPTPEEMAAGHANRSDFEYLEFYNRSDQAIHLEGVHLASGVDYRFAQGQELAPGARLLIVRNEAAFRHRFGSGLPIVGEYEGRLSDGGEKITVVGGDGGVLLEIRYDDREPWPEDADGDGAALVMKDVARAEDANDPASWGSANNGGNPGFEAVIDGGGPVVGEDALAQWMRDRGIEELKAADLLTFALGADLLPGVSPLTIAPAENAGEIILSYHRRTDAGDVRYAVEASTDLETWDRLHTAEAEATAAAPGTTRVRLQPVSRDLGSYFRLAVETGE